ncbi:hypothetical protein ABZP36_023858 [Zizania latifolia]
MQTTRDSDPTCQRLRKGSCTPAAFLEPSSQREASPPTTGEISESLLWLDPAKTSRLRAGRAPEPDPRILRFDSSGAREEPAGFEVDFSGRGHRGMMVGFMGKRKELEQVGDGLSDICLSGPAAKSRRLDIELPPIMEEESPGPSTPFGHEMLGEEINSAISIPIMKDNMEGEMESHLSSEEKALVLYKPIDNTVLIGPGISNPSIIISTDLIRGLKNQAFNRRNYHGLEDKSPQHSNFLALVPWTPPHIAKISDQSASNPENTELFEVPMESDEAEVDSMDVEESSEATVAAIDSESLHLWQHHCMTPSSLQNPSAPVMWSR